MTSNNDMKIIEELSGLRSEVRAYINTHGTLLAKHDLTLYGEHGNNGLTTVVSNMRQHWKQAIWIVGILFAAGVGVAAKALALL